MKKLLSLVFSLLITFAAFSGLAKQASATKLSPRAEASQWCKSEGKKGKELSACIKDQLVNKGDASQTDDDPPPPVDEDDTTTSE